MLGDAGERRLVLARDSSASRARPPQRGRCNRNRHVTASLESGPSEPADNETLTQKAARGVRWTTTSMIVVTALQLAQVAVLARLLPRTDFGLMAMITVVLGFGAAYADMGLSNAVIYRQDATRDQLSSLYWLNVLAGLGVYAAILALTAAIAAFYREPRLLHLLPVAGLVFVIAPFGQQFRALLQRGLRFRLLATVDMCAAATGAAIAIVCAVSGLGVLSLIAGQLVNTAVRAATLCTIGWRSERPRLQFRWHDTRGFVSFGLYQMGERSVNQLTANLDYLVIGRMLGPAVLGTYAIAYQLVVMPMMKMSPVLMRVAFPVFAMRQNDPATLRRGYARVSGLLAFAVCPFLVALVILAPVVVPVVYGPKWPDAIPLVQVLGVMALLKILSNPSGAVFLAIGRANVGFWLNLGTAVAALGGFVVAATYGGATGVAWAWAAIAAGAFSVILLLLRRFIGLGLREYFATLRRPLWIIAAAGLVVATGRWALAPVVANQLLLLGVLVVLGVSVYFALWWLVDRSYVVTMVRVLAGRKVEES